MYAQIIDDAAGKTLAAASTLDKSSKVKEVRAYFLDLTEPVAPTITIDDRREEAEKDDQNESV